MYRYVTNGNSPKTYQKKMCHKAIYMLVSFKRVHTRKKQIKSHHKEQQNGGEGEREAVAGFARHQPVERQKEESGLVMEPRREYERSNF